MELILRSSRGCTHDSCVANLNIAMVLKPEYTSESLGGLVTTQYAGSTLYFPIYWIWNGNLRICISNKIANDVAGGSLGTILHQSLIHSPPSHRDWVRNGIIME